MRILVSAGLALVLALPAWAAEAPGRADEALAVARRAVWAWYEVQAAKGDGEAALWLAEHSPPEASLAWYRKAAERGVAEACGELAWRYDKGQDAPRDEAEALRWMEKGAAADDETAIEALADRYRDGRGVPADLAKALALYERLETEPDEDAIPALLEAGRQAGKPAAPTFGTLLAILQAAAAQGEARANWALYAFTHEDFGTATAGVEPALPYLHKAADAGYPRAAAELGSLYALGIPDLVAADFAAAFAWFRKAAQAGYSPAVGSVVQALETGALGGRDPAEALAWLRRSAEAGDAEAQAALAERLGTGTYPGGPPGIYPYDEDGALGLLERSAQAGNAHAMYLLGLYNLDGKPFARNPGAAATWLRKAADLGHEGALGTLAELYEAGHGVPADLAKAFELHKEAGNLIRQGRSYRDGRGVAANPYLALACFLAEYDRGMPSQSEALVWIGRMFEQGRGVIQDGPLGLALYEQSHSLAGALLRVQYEDRLPGATLQSRLEAYRAIAADLPGGAVPAEPAAALAWFRRAAREYLERFEDGSL